MLYLLKSKGLSNAKCLEIFYIIKKYKKVEVEITAKIGAIFTDKLKFLEIEVTFKIRAPFSDKLLYRSIEVKRI